VTVRASHRRILTASYGVIAAYVLVLFGPSAGGIALTALPAVNIALVLCARLSADKAGVTVVNVWPGHLIPWAEIDDFRVGRSDGATCLDVERALAEADAGHYATASKLVAEGRVDAVSCRTS
jgi:hypothetical protein